MTRYLSDEQPETPEHDDQLSPVDGIVWPHGSGGDAESANSSESAGEEEAERVLAVATETRRLLSEPSSNVGADGRPHFLRIVEGEPESSGLCGQCGEEWPCPEFRALTPESEHADRTGLVQAIVSELAARGINPDTLGR